MRDYQDRLFRGKTNIGDESLLLGGIMSRRDESEFPFAYLSEQRERAMPGPNSAPSARSISSKESRSMTQQIKILLLIAVISVLVFLILLYFTIMTITSDSAKSDDKVVETTISQSESVSMGTTAPA